MDPKWRNKIWYTPATEYYLALERKFRRVPQPRWTWRLHAEWNQRVIQEQTLYDFTYVRSLEWSDAQRQKIGWWAPGAGGAGMVSWCVTGTGFQLGKMREFCWAVLIAAQQSLWSLCHPWEFRRTESRDAGLVRCVGLAIVQVCQGGCSPAWPPVAPQGQQAMPM